MNSPWSRAEARVGSSVSNCIALLTLAESETAQPPSPRAVAPTTVQIGCDAADHRDFEARVYALDLGFNSCLCFAAVPAGLRRWRREAWEPPPSPPEPRQWPRGLSPAGRRARPQARLLLPIRFIQGDPDAELSQHSKEPLQMLS